MTCIKENSRLEIIEMEGEALTQDATRAQPWQDLRIEKQGVDYV